MKLVKVLSGIVVVLVILAVAAAVIIPLALDPTTTRTMFKPWSKNVPGGI